MNNFYGKYRGKVTLNVDPMALGRIQVEVPAVLGASRENWAMPCVPYAGPNVGLYTIPPVGANVWVEFEGGDPNYPIWAGCFWGEGELPLEPAVPEIKVLKIEGITLTLNGVEGEGGATLEVTSPLVEQPLTLKMNQAGIELQNGTQTKILMTLETVEISNGETTRLTMTADSVEVSVEPCTISVSGAESSIKLNTGASSATLNEEEIALQLEAHAVNITPEGIEASAAPSTLSVTPEAIEASAAPASITVSAEAIALSNGAGNIDITPATVSINEGALEVM